MFVFQGDYEWKGQFHECWKSGDRVWAHPDEVPWGQHPHHPPWHAVPKADCADFNRKWRCFVLIHQENELNGPSPIYIDKAKGIKTFLTLDVFSKQVTEFPGPLRIAKCTTVSRRHWPPSCEKSKDERVRKAHLKTGALGLCRASRVCLFCWKSDE